MNEVEFISSVKYAVDGGRGRLVLFVGCVYMLTDVLVLLLWMIVTIGSRRMC